MPVTVFIPAQLRKLTGNVAWVEVEADTVGRVIRRLEERFPGISEHLIEGDDLRGSIAVSVNGEIATRGLMEPVPEGGQVHFVPAIGGGTDCLTNFW